MKTISWLLMVTMLALGFVTDINALVKQSSTPTTTPTTLSANIVLPDTIYCPKEAVRCVFPAPTFIIQL